MSHIVIELPDELSAELRERHLSDRAVNDFVLSVVQAWFRAEREHPLTTREKPAPASSPFAESAATFTDQFVAENRGLFERLARLPDGPT